MVKYIKLGPVRLEWVLRHIWEEDITYTNYEVWDMRKRPQLGIWFNREKAVGPVKKGNNSKETASKTFSENNLVNIYTMGLKLFVCHTWIRIQFKPTLGSTNIK